MKKLNITLALIVLAGISGNALAAIVYQQPRAGIVTAKQKTQQQIDQIVNQIVKLKTAYLREKNPIKKLKFEAEVKALQKKLDTLRKSLR